MVNNTSNNDSDWLAETDEVIDWFKMISLWIE